jgi:hypothetical protein
VIEKVKSSLSLPLRLLWSKALHCAPQIYLKGREGNGMVGETMEIFKDFISPPLHPNLERIKILHLKGR